MWKSLRYCRAISLDQVNVASFNNWRSNINLLIAEVEIVKT